MKILNSEIISKEENVLIVGINAALDSSNIVKVFKDQYNLDLIDTTALKDGDIVVYKNQIAFKLGFDAWVSFSLMLDRVGNFVGLTTLNGVSEEQKEDTAAQVSLMEADFIKRREREIIEAIAEPLDKKQLNELFEKEFNLKISGSLNFKNGKMVAYENFAVYKLNYDAQLRFYLLMDRAGNYLALADNEEFLDESDKIENDNTLDFSLSL
jgi:hypothetical protein